MPQHDQESGRKPTLVGVVRATLRAKHYSPRTEEAYVGWIRRFIRFHQKRHPRTMGETEVVAFLSSLAMKGHVAASTQNQALSALVFLYGEVLGVELDWLQVSTRTRRGSSGGSGCFRQRGHTSTPALASGAGITSTSRFCSVRSRWRSIAPA